MPPINTDNIVFLAKPSLNFSHA